MVILLYNTLDVPKIIAVAPLIYLGIMLYVELRKDKIKQLEEKNPKLKEKLRTVIDTFDANTEIAKDLKKGVLNDLKNVKISQFIEQKKIFADFIFIISLVVIITIMLPYKIDNKFFDFKSELSLGDELYKKIFVFADKTKEKEDENSEDKGDKAGRNRFTAIFGNKTVLKTGEEEIGIELESKTSIAKSEGTELKNIKEEYGLFRRFNDVSQAEVYVQESDEEKKKIIEEFYSRRDS